MSTAIGEPVPAGDALVRAVEAVGSPVCVGVDPVLERLPDPLRPAGTDPSSAVDAIRSFCLGVLDAVASRVPCVKLQSACFERYRWRGVAVLEELIGEARLRSLHVILDAKRGDVGVTAAHYAAAVFAPGVEPAHRPHWVTINPYFGADGIDPFLEGGHGAFALVRTSNPGGDALQQQRLADGRTVAEAVARMVAALGRPFVGEEGYSSLGAVVAATRPDDAARLREAMPTQIFLVPGYGAQGAGVDDVRPCFDARGRGAVVTASRSVIHAFAGGDGDWVHRLSEAADRLADDVGSAVGMR